MCVCDIIRVYKRAYKCACTCVRAYICILYKCIICIHVDAATLRGRTPSAPPASQSGRHPARRTMTDRPTDRRGGAEEPISRRTRRFPRCVCVRASYTVQRLWELAATDRRRRLDGGDGGDDDDDDGGIVGGWWRWRR